MRESFRHRLWLLWAGYSSARIAFVGGIQRDAPPNVQERDREIFVNKTSSAYLLATITVAVAVHGQGTVFLNNYDSRMGIYVLDISTPAFPPTPFEIFAGPSLGSLSPISNSAGEGPIFTIAPEGVLALGPNSGSYFDEGYGSVPGVPALGTAWFLIRAWTGPNWDSATYRGEVGWSQSLGTVHNPVPLNIPQPITIGLFETPEPQMILLAVLGLAGLLVFVRNKPQPRVGGGG